MKKIGIILINYKNYAHKYLQGCRDSLRLQTYSDFQVYIVDNASSPETFSYLKDFYPEAVVLCREDGNYCAANNVGMRQAIQDGCDYVVSANMDTEFEADWLEELVTALDANPDAGIAQSLIRLYPKDEDQRKDPLINTAGNIIHFLFFGFTSHYGEKSSSLKIKDYSDIPYASGCSFIMRKEVFEEIGGYNEEYYMYHDDLDISLKTRLAGHRVIIALKSKMFHKYEFERSIRMVYYMERNRALSFFSFYSLPKILLISPVFLAMDLGITMLALIGPWFGTKMEVDAYFLKSSSWRLIREIRRHLRQISKKPFEEISSGFTGKIEFQEVDNFVLRHLVNPVFNLFWKIVK